MESPPSGEDLLDALARGDHPQVAFTGGEPTLHDELPGWIRQARREGADRIVLQTNARRLAYRAYAATLARAGAHALDVSLHGPSAEVHDHHTRVPGSFEQTLAGIAAARGRGLEVGVSVVITRSNFRNLAQLVRRAVGQGVTRLRLTPARACGEAKRLLPRVVPRLTLVRPRLAAAGEVAASLGAQVLVAGVPPCLVWDGQGAGPRPGLVLAAGDAGDALPAACRDCALAGQCAGVDPGYLSHHGSDELRPLAADQVSTHTPPDTQPDDLFPGLGRVYRHTGDVGAPRRGSGG